MGVVAYVLDRAGLPVIASVAIGAVVYAGALYILREPLLAYLLPSLRRNA
jgi:hypothetical protein